MDDLIKCIIGTFFIIIHLMDADDVVLMAPSSMVYLRYYMCVQNKGENVLNLDGVPGHTGICLIWYV